MTCIYNCGNFRYCSLGVPEEEKEGAEESIKLKPYFNTISDATFPLFRRNGLPASQALYDSRVTRHYTELSKETIQEKSKSKVFKKLDKMVKELGNLELLNHQICNFHYVCCLKFYNSICSMSLL